MLKRRYTRELSTYAGCTELAREIEAYWRGLGRHFVFSIINTAERGSSMWGIKSNCINGYPPRFERNA